jgi:hypothetical protein
MEGLNLASYLCMDVNITIYIKMDELALASTNFQPDFYCISWFTMNKFLYKPQNWK